MTDDTTFQEQLDKEGLESGSKIQFSVPDVPYSAITYDLKDDPKLAMWLADQWRLAYLEQFDEGVATNEEAPAPVIQETTQEIEADGQPMYEVRTVNGDTFPVCPVHKYNGNPSRFFLNTYPPEQRFMFKFENVGLQENTWFCGGKEVVDGKTVYCDRFVSEADFRQKHIVF
jgi:hypothetical protein